MDGPKPACVAVSFATLGAAAAESKMLPTPTELFRACSMLDTRARSFKIGCNDKF